MKINPHTIRIVNLTLLFACLLTGLTAPFVLPAKARVSCEYPALASDPVRFSWAPNTNVTVEIDDTWSESDRGAFQSGISRWNDWKSFDCSNVTFSKFNTRHFDTYDVPPPNNTVFWEQHEFGTNFHGNTSQIFGGSPQRVVGAVVEIDPGLVNNAASNTSGPFALFNYDAPRT